MLRCYDSVRGHKTVCIFLKTDVGKEATSLQGGDGKKAAFTLSMDLITDVKTAMCVGTAVVKRQQLCPLQIICFRSKGRRSGAKLSPTMTRELLCSNI